MIKCIELKNEATYKNVQILNNLKKVNYFYGTNGVGKTSIGNILENINNFPESKIEWENDEKEILVYNKNFIEQNFGENKNEHPGIFTLGNASKTELESIEKLKETINNLISKIEDKQTFFNQFQNEKIEIENNFKEVLWQTKKKYDKVISDAFEGSNSSKDKLKLNFIENINNNSSKILSLEELKEKHNLLYSDEKTEIDEIDFSFIDNLLLKEVNIFLKPIIGSNDLDISTLIKKLGNADWVYKGLEYLDDNIDSCPFCQQNISSKRLKEILNNFFDINFTSELQNIKDIHKNYSQTVLECSEKFEHIFLKVNKLKINKKDLNAIQNLVIILKEKITQNLLLIKEKIKEPSRKISLNDISEDIILIKTHSVNLNSKIKEYNNIIKNLKKSKEDYKETVWKYFVESLRPTYDLYIKNINKVDNQISRIILAKKNLSELLSKNEKELETAISNLTSTKPTIDAINSLLKEFGFKGFNLTESSTGHYQIIRENGELANNTLSEGEKTFVTFLYFYHLIKGAHNKDNIHKEKIILIDDPISSLDSVILFIVSTLIKNITTDIIQNNGAVKQIFILTHNVYFHKEISFTKINQQDTRYFIIRKHDNNTEIEDCGHQNKIQTSYQLLWNEVKSTENNSISLQNSMRRILENFFGFLGKRYDDEIISLFDNIEEKCIVKSLFAWVNDGSHCIQDDINLNCIDNITTPFKETFKKIFIKTGYEPHYNMMIQ